MTFYGAPWGPDLHGWAVHRDADALAEKWAAIPDGTDVLITHTSPDGILDHTSRSRHCGCRALAWRIESVSHRLHCFGHVRASTGVFVEGATTYVSAAMADRRYEIARPALMIEL